MKEHGGLPHDLDDFDCICKKDGKRIAVGGHAKTHMISFKINAETLCDMIQNPIPCNSPRGKPHRPKARRVCAYRKGRKYNIILDPMILNDEECWVVSNMEPLK